MPRRFYLGIYILQTISQPHKTADTNPNISIYKTEY